MNENKIDTMNVIDLYNMVSEGVLDEMPNDLWLDEDGFNNACICIRYLIQEVLKEDPKAFIKQIGNDFFKENGLSEMLNKCFNGDYREAVIKAFPEHNFKPWQFKRVGDGYWTLENSIEALKWLIEEELQLNEDEVKEQLCSELLKDYNLYYMVRCSF